ncbi:MAG: translation initiation factor IF-2 subunit beta [Candidatus Marsarchaeota archaeon]|nr:translation initiation factor IF-2 subunit beta [Candidatus Marsarchaeota archaeon]MCL5102086.1 translation initiation factor IF-2 subunit beta [Candidatus Marsarchaeota archaeon]
MIDISDKEYMELLDRAFSKLPSLEAEKSDFVIPKVESMIQGNKTTIRNIASIADKARRKVEDIARYLSKEFGVPTSMEEQRLVLTGKFSQEQLDKEMLKYFETYVICRECHKPDTHLENAGRGMLMLVCEACGARYGLKNY